MIGAELWLPEAQHGLQANCDDGMVNPADGSARLHEDAMQHEIDMRLRHCLEINRTEALEAKKLRCMRKIRTRTGSSVAPSPYSMASSSSIMPEMIERPFCQKAGSEASRPNGLSSSLWCLVPPALSIAKYLSWNPAALS